MNPENPSPRVVLYTEDDENDIFLMRHAFKRAGVATALHVATDGQQAIDYLAGQGTFADRTQHPVPDLLLLDLNLPMRSGFEVLAWTRQQPAYAQLVIIIFSSSNHQKDIDTARTLGANDYVVKPANVSKRLELVQRLHEVWFGAARPPA